MTYYRFKESKLTKVLFGLFLFAILLLSRNTLFTSTIVGFTKAQLGMYGLIGLLGICFLLTNGKNWKQILTDGRIVVLCICTVVMMLPMVVKQDWQTMYFSVLLCLYVAIFFSYFLTYKEIATYFVGFMVFLGVYSVLAEYVLDAMETAGWFSVPVFRYSDDRSFRNYALAFVVAKSNYFRNYGIFREPGLYQFFLLMAMYLNNYTLSWKKIWKLWVVNGILAITMLSTFSTVGVVAMGLFAIVLFLDKKLYQDKRVLIALAVCAAIGVVALIVIILQQGALFRTLRSMVRKLYVINDSSESRYEAIFADIWIFAHHPLFGGIFADTLYAVDHNTASTLLLYAVYGVAGGTLNVLAWVALVWRKERKLWLNLMLLMTMIMAVNTQNFTTDVFFWLFPVMALVEHSVPMLKKGEKS